MIGRRRVSLTAIVARRILAFAALAMALQIGIVFTDYWFDDEELGYILIERETQAIADSVHRVGGELKLDADAPVLSRYVGLADDNDQAAEGDSDLVSRLPPATYVRIRLADGRPVYSNCDHECLERLLPQDIDPPDFWQRTLAPGKPLTVAGGRAFIIDGERVLIDVAVLRDPDNFLTTILLHEMIDHMLVPMGLLLVLTIGATLVSIRQALKPVAAAAAAADQLTPGRGGRIAVGRTMPVEIARFAEAINRLIGRTHELFTAQKVFAAAIAHEIRTPVAVVKLELERIDGERARRAERDLDRLMHVLEQLTALARLDAIEPSAFVSTDLTALAANTVADLAPLVLDRGKRIVFDGDAPVEVTLVPALIENVIRNLIENAVKHTGDDTEITVSVTPDGTLSVADDGPGFEMGDGLAIDVGRVKRSGSLGMGLRIVERIAELHGTTPTIISGPGRGTVIRLAFARTKDR
jgi:signal transduction histidine kinase